MAFVGLGAWRARSAARAEGCARLKTALAEALGLASGDALAVNEVACADLGCPDVETVVLVTREGEPTRALRVALATAAIGPAEIAGLVRDERLGRPEGRRRGSGPVRPPAPRPRRPGC